MKSATGRPSCENLAFIARLMELSLCVFLPTALFRSHFTEGTKTRIKYDVH